MLQLFVVVFFMLQKLLLLLVARCLSGMRLVPHLDQLRGLRLRAGERDFLQIHAVPWLNLGLLVLRRRIVELHLLLSLRLLWRPESVVGVVVVEVRIERRFGEHFHRLWAGRLVLQRGFPPR